MSREHMNSLHLRFRTSRLVGGVLLVALLALVPSSSASAYKAVFDNKNSANTYHNTSNLGYIINGEGNYGCSLANVYNPGTNTDPGNTFTVLGDSLTGHYCENTVYFSDNDPDGTAVYREFPIPDSHLYSRYIYKNNAIESTDSFSYSGYRDDHNSNNFNKKPLISIVDGFSASVSTPQNSGITASDLYPSVSASLNNPYYIGHISFAINDPIYWATGFQPKMDFTDVHLKSYRDGSDLSDNNQNRYIEFMREVNDSIVFTCDSDFNESFLPPGIADPNNLVGDYVCSIFFELPVVQGYYYDFYNDTYGSVGPQQLFRFYYEGPIRGYEDWITNGIIDDYAPIRFMFRNNYFYGQDHSMSDFSYVNPYFQLFVCEDQYECDYLKNLNSVLKDNRKNLTERPTDNSTPEGSIFDSWWSVFGFNFLFPFRSLFGSFTDQSCVQIPIIAGMVHSSNTTYCSWFPASVKNVATPVLVSIAMMVLTGFIYSWLRDSDRMSISVSKGGKK